jgi:hypothetical protein
MFLFPCAFAGNSHSLGIHGLRLPLQVIIKKFSWKDEMLSIMSHFLTLSQLECDILLAESCFRCDGITIITASKSSHQGHWTTETSSDMANRTPIPPRKYFQFTKSATAQNWPSFFMMPKARWRFQRLLAHIPSCYQ